MDFQNIALCPPKRHRTWGIGSLAIVVVIAATIGLAQLGPVLPTTSRSNLWVDTVHRGNRVINVRADGTLVSKVHR